jgi:putative flippase GtrA
MRRRFSRAEVTRFLKFSAVGTLGFVIDVGLFNLLHTKYGWSEIPAETVSFLVAVTSNFIWNRYWTYPDSRSKPVGRQAVQFGVVSVAGWLIRTVALAALLGPSTRVAEAILRTPFGAALPVSAAWLGDNMALALVILVVLFWNFLANRLWTYSDVDRASESVAAGPAGIMRPERDA